MTKEVIKRPSSEPVTIANNANQALYKNFREWREYASALEEDVKNLSERVIELNEQSQPEIESLKTQLISREKQVMELKETDKAQGKEVVQLKSQLQQQALPVVPECVAKLSPFDDMKEYVLDERLLTIREYLNKLDDKSNSDITAAEAWCLIHEDIVYRAMLDGYTVEKPKQKRYEVKLLSGESMHFNPIGNPKNIKDYRFSFGNYAGWKTQFTKSELAEIKDGMFLKRIPGGTPLDDLGKDKSYYVWLDDCNYWINPLIELVPVEDGE